MPAPPTPLPIHPSPAGARRCWGWLIVVGLAALAACEQSTPVPREPDGPAFTAEPLPPLASPCPQQRGMVGVPFPDGTCYLMDPWPVTRGEYLEALTEGPLVSDHPECADHPPGNGPRERTHYDALEGNTMGDYCVIGHALDDLDGGTLTVDNRMYWPPEEADREEPMVCVTWCDAHAYCDRVGKRLCNHRGLTEADHLLDATVLHDPENDEFFNACTGGGTRASPTGLPWPLVEREPKRIPPHFYVLGEPLARRDLTEGGEGAFAGIWGLSVGGEYTGPMHFSTRPPRFFINDDPVPQLSACGAQRRHLDQNGRVNQFRHTGADPPWRT